MPVYEGPSIDEAISKGLHALGLKKEAVDIEILSDAKKGFLGMGKKDARVSIEPIIVEKNIVTSEAAEEPIKEQFVEEKLEEEVSKPIETTDTPSQLVEEKLSVVVNVGNYRQKREEVLTRLAQRTAEKVKETGRPVFLEPMPAFERKMIHSALSKDEYIKTHSEGEDPYRYLVVEPAKKYF